MMQSRITANINDFRYLLTRDSLKIVEEELLPDEEVGKFENVKRLYLELTPSARDEAEMILEELHKKYVPELA